MSSRLKTGVRVREVLAEGRVANSRAVRVCCRAQNGFAFGSYARLSIHDATSVTFLVADRYITRLGVSTFEGDPHD